MKIRGGLVHLFTVAAARLESDAANPKMIDALRELVKRETARVTDGRTWSKEEDARVDAQRTLFNMLPTGGAKDKLKNAMLQRAYDLMWDGDCGSCDALLQFLPSMDADALLDDWEKDAVEGNRSRWYRSAES